MLWPTTYGLGPFYPMIAFDDVWYRIDAEYEEEGQAYAHAHSVYMAAKDKFIAALKDAQAQEFRSR